MLCLSENPVYYLNQGWQTLSVNGEVANTLDCLGPGTKPRILYKYLQNKSKNSCPVLYPVAFNWRYPLQDQLAVVRGPGSLGWGTMVSFTLPQWHIGPSVFSCRALPSHLEELTRVKATPRLNSTARCSVVAICKVLNLSMVTSLDFGKLLVGS